MGLAEAVVPIALGLLVAVPALWCYKYLCSRAEAFKIEMENTSLDLANRLTLHLTRPHRLQ